MTDDQRRTLIIAEARSWIGTPYRHQASLKGVGCDCLGLLRGIWRAAVGDEPEATPPYAQAAMALERDETLLEAALRHLHTVDEARPGDAMLFRWRAHLPARHVGIVVAPGMMVHAQEGARVCEVTLSPWWLRHAAGCFAFPGTVR